MKRLMALALALLALAVTTGSEPLFVSLSASQVVGAAAFPRYTKSVVIVSDGADVCYFRLFTDIDTEGNATTSHAPIKSGETLGFQIYPECTGANAAACRDSESYVGTGSRRAAYYKSISYICGAGDTATIRVYYK